MSDCRISPHFMYRKPKPFFWFVSTASCTVPVIVSLDVGIQSVTLPIAAFTEPMVIFEDPQTSALHNSL